MNKKSIKVLFGFLFLLSNLVYSQKSISIEELKQTYKNIKKTYTRKGGYEVLTDIDAFYIQNNGQKVSTLPVIEPDAYPCGNVYRERYIIKKTKKTFSKYKIEKIKTYSSHTNHIDILYLIGLPKEIDSITFLGEKKRYYWSKNSEYLGIKKGYPNRVIVYKNNQVGMYSYDTQNKHKLPEKKRVKGEPIIPPKPFFGDKFYINLEEEISISDIQILYDEYEGVVKVLSENKISFLFDIKPRTYDYAEKVTSVFYKVYKNKKEGFLDISENQEYGL